MSILESQNLELREKLEGALYQNEKMANELKLLRECHDIFHGFVEDLSQFGSRVDTNPTIADCRDASKVADAYEKQLNTQEQYIRRTASEIIGKVNKYMKDADIV